MESSNIAIRAEYSVTRRESKSSEPTVGGRTSFMALSAAFGSTTSIKVIQRQKLQNRFAATRTKRRVCAVGNKSLKPELIPVSFSMELALLGVVDVPLLNDSASDIFIGMRHGRIVAQGSDKPKRVYQWDR